MGNIWENMYKRICKETWNTCFFVFDFVYHFYRNTLGTWIGQLYYHEPLDCNIEFPEYYKIFDLFEHRLSKEISVYYSKQHAVSTNFPITVFPQAVLDFSNPENVDNKMETIENHNIIDSLWIGKLNDEEISYFYCYSMLNNIHRKFAKIEEFMKETGKKKSKVEFLFIEYTHPKMKHTIELAVPKQFMICNNEIFSVGFVFYLLKMQNVTFEFDLDYKLNILDGHIHKTKLTANNFVVIHENDYKVISIDN